ncbi:pleiotropic drug resistance protein 3-like [Quillaja saponaria]|uniref:Pleiotropic drug resistance protein 3-like n=1 Tax=Quillaja saponaria TaxID=32244 RepID=A0AAD7QA91_QUISA|nr:pleiotropic drug resistance protein 3-like [Quillaja saponaria]
MVASITAGNFAILFVFLFSGFIIKQPSMPGWLKWVFWLSPLTYGEIGLSLNEFLAPRWKKMLATSNTIGEETLESRGLDFPGFHYWISLGSLFGFTIVFNVGFVLALSYLKSPGSFRAIISFEKLTQMQGSEGSQDSAYMVKKSKFPKDNVGPRKG